jgi:hypothetical protein
MQMQVIGSIFHNLQQIVIINSVFRLEKYFHTSTFQKNSQMSNENIQAIEIEAKDNQTMSKRALKRQKYQLSKEEKKKRVKEKRALVQEIRELGLPEDVLEATDYYFENGLRKVKVIIQLERPDCFAKKHFRIFFI